MTGGRAGTNLGQAIETGEGGEEGGMRCTRTWALALALVLGAAVGGAATTETSCSNGLDDDDDKYFDCEDPDCAGDPGCAEGGRCGDGLDNDGDGRSDCADSECCADPACAGSPSCPERACDDGLDGDGDGLTDCADPDCRNQAPCLERGNCADGADNDGDGRVDCADTPDCCADPSCDGSPLCPEDGCGDGGDDDGDGLIDCADPDCMLSGDCTERGYCDDGLDNDSDGIVDCPDPDCVGSPECPERDHCADAVDNDGDGLADCDDADCCDECPPRPECPERRCSDGADNDADGDADCLDADCAGDEDCLESVNCSDGVDNDLDGLVDCADPDCTCRNELGRCGNGVDDDRDGLADCDDSDCCDDPSCSGSGRECVELACGNGIDDDGDSFTDCEDFDCRRTCPCEFGRIDACRADRGVLDPPTLDCRLVSGQACAAANPYEIVLEPGRTTVFTFCDATCPGAGATFAAGFTLDGPDGVRVSSEACGGRHELRVRPDPALGYATWCLRIGNHDPRRGGRAYTFGYRLECEAPGALAVTPSWTPASAGCASAFTVAVIAPRAEPLDWAWTLTPPAGGSDTPSSGTDATSDGTLRFDVSATGAGAHALEVVATNRCGQSVRRMDIVIVDRAAPDLVATADEAACATPAPSPLRSLARRAAAAGLAEPAPPAPAVDSGAPVGERVARRRALEREARRLDGSARDEALAKARALPAELLVRDATPALAKSLGCSPCTTGVLEADQPWLDVFVRCGDGAFAVRTGARHPATVASGSPQDVTYGGRIGLPGTSEIGVHVHGVGTFLNPPGARSCGFDPPDTASEPASVGIETEWQLAPEPGMTLSVRHEVVAFGTSLADAGLRLTLGVTNDATSTVDARVGLRWQVDAKHAFDDGPVVATARCEPPSLSPDRDTEHDFAPAELLDFLRVRNDETSPLFEISAATAPIPGFPDMAIPERLVYGRWRSLRSAPWGFGASEGATGPGDDSALLVEHGATPSRAALLRPGDGVTRSFVLLLSRDGVGCGAVRDGAATHASVTTCAGSCVRLRADAADECPGAVARLVSSSPGAPACSPPCTARFDAPGVFAYEWEATDAAGHVTRATTTVTVRDATSSECNRPPSCDPGGPYASSCTSVALAGAATDPDGDPLSPAWTTTCPGASFLPDAARWDPQLVVPAACDATCEVTLTATDPAGLSCAGSARVTLRDDAAPALSGVPALTRVSCDAPVPLAAVTALDACDPAPALEHADREVPLACPDARDVIRTWTARDRCGNAASREERIEIRDERAPVMAGVPADVVVECTDVPAMAAVAASDDCDPAPVVGASESRVDGRCPGEYELRRAWTARDRCGNESADSQRVSVRDTTPPVVTPSDAVFACLWPPPHRMACFGPADVAPAIADACSGPVTWRFSGCASSQPDDGLGDGSTDGDCVVAPDGSGFCVRSERQGMEPGGRYYAVSVTATDACGNVSAPVPIGRVWIPHDAADFERGACRRP